MNKLFFSLVDYRNNYFTSQDPEKVVEFYDSFNSREQLIQWMMERPSGTSNIHETEGDKEIVVVIPTADFNGKYAKECRENIFNGLHIVFVESGEVPDPYFNYAHNYNVGVKRAMEYNPKWIVLSNDDVYMIDGIDILKSNLSNLDDEVVDVVFTNKSLYHSAPKIIIKRNFITNMVNRIRFGTFGEEMNKLFDKFGVTTLISNDRFIQRMTFKSMRYDDLISFGIFSRKFILEKKMNLFDEVFINEGEDSDLSISLKIEMKNVAYITYKIGDRIGMSLGTNMDRKMRSIAGLAFLDYKWSKKCERFMTRSFVK